MSDRRGRDDGGIGIRADLLEGSEAATTVGLGGLTGSIGIGVIDSSEGDLRSLAGHTEVIFTEGADSDDSDPGAGWCGFQGRFQRTSLALNGFPGETIQGPGVGPIMQTLALADVRLYTAVKP